MKAKNKMKEKTDTPFIVVELFSGSGSFSEVMEERGYYTLKVDIEEKYNPDLVADIEFLKVDELPGQVNGLWASVPCNAFSIASCYHHWDSDGMPKSDFARKSLRLLDNTIRIIKKVDPEFWVIENPRGLMRKKIDYYFKKHDVKAIRYTVWYCQYGDTRAKPTDIFTNIKGFQPKTCRNNKMGCNHERAKRGSKTGGTQALSNAYERSRIPLKLIRELIPQTED